jgi:hypothetical protein
MNLKKWSCGGYRLHSLAHAFQLAFVLFIFIFGCVNELDIYILCFSVFLLKCGLNVFFLKNSHPTPK